MVCEILKEWHDLLKQGLKADDFIPYSLDCTDEESLFELYNFAIKYLEDEQRKSFCKEKLEELIHASK